MERWRNEWRKIREDRETDEKHVGKERVDG